MEPPEDTQSECPGRSHASKSTVFDTQSEPPGLSYMKADNKLLKRRESGGKSSVKYSAASTVRSAAVGASSSSTSVCTDSRSVVSSSSNASKLDARVQSSSRSQNATASRASKSRASATAASSKKKDPSLSISSNYRSVKSKSSKISSSPSSNNKLALVPKSKVNDPPTTRSDSPSTAHSAPIYNSLDPPYEEQQEPSASDESHTTGKKGNNRLTTIDSASGNESSEYDEEYDDDDQSRDSYTRASELASAVGRALVKRRESLASEEQERQNQLVHYNASADPDNVGGGLVPAKERYLASAVDNMGSMVPVDSESYEAYDHTFVTCPEYLRFRFLYTFLRKNLDKKILIFFSTSNSVRFHAELLKRLRIHVLTMHSRQRREKFINTFFKFADMEEGILLSTDAAGRDLDIPPSVDYVMQFEPPDDPSEYILRIARISCDSDRIGRSVLFLNPGEQGFLKYYNSAAITVSEFELPKLADNQLQIESKVNESERLLQFAKDAYGSYLIAYASHGFRDVYNVHDLNKGDVAAAFGLVEVPHGDEGEEESTYAGNSGRKATWELTKKPKNKTWMRGEKSWPHAQIKVHPKFKQNGANKQRSYDDETKELID